MYKLYSTPRPEGGQFSPALYHSEVRYEQPEGPRPRIEESKSYQRPHSKGNIQLAQYIEIIKLCCRNVTVAIQN